ATPQCVEHQSPDGGAVAGAGEPMGKPPVLQGIARRPTMTLDIGQHLDGGGQARSGGHREPQAVVVVGWIERSENSSTALPRGAALDGFAPVNPSYDRLG